MPFLEFRNVVYRIPMIPLSRYVRSFCLGSWKPTEISALKNSNGIGTVVLCTQNASTSLTILSSFYNINEEGGITNSALIKTLLFITAEV